MQLHNVFAQQATIDSLKKILPTIQNSQKKIDLMNEISYAYSTVNADTAWSIAERNYAQARQINYVKGMAKAAYYKGVSAFYLGNYELDIKNSLESLSLYESIKDTFGIAQAYSGLGISYEYMEQNNLAIQYMQSAVKFAQLIQANRVLAVTYCNLANLYTKIHQPEQALVYALNSKKFADLLPKDFRIQIYALNAICRAYIEMENYPLALQYVQEYTQIAKRVNDKDAEVFGASALGMIYKGMGNYKEAEKAFIHAEKVSIDIHSLARIKEVYLKMAQLYEMMEDYKKSANYFYKYALIKDTLLNEANKLNIQQIQHKYELEKKETENILLRQQQQLDQSTLDRQFWIIVATVSLLSTLTIISILLYRTKLKNERNNQVLLNKNKQIEQQSKKIENQLDILVMQSRSLAELNTTKDKLFSIIGHDLRSPINSLKAVLELMSHEGISKSDFFSYTKKLQNSITNIDFMLNNLLMWSQSQMKGISSFPRQTSLYELGENNSNLFAQAMMNKQILLINQIEEKAIVWADTNQIDIVFRNLINNAIKFTPKNGEITLNSHFQDTYWKVVIQNTGVGIKAEDIGKLFDNQTHFSTHGTNHEKGTGLGLLLCQEMIQKNGGKIWVESEEGKKTMFYFSLPVA